MKVASTTLLVLMLLRVWAQPTQFVPYSQQLAKSCYQQPNNNHRTATFYDTISYLHSTWSEDSLNWAPMDSGRFGYTTTGIKIYDDVFRTSVVGPLVFMKHHDYLYDRNNNLMLLLEKAMNFSKNMVENSVRVLITYSSTGLLLKNVQQIWDDINNQWETRAQYIWNYDTSGNLINFTAQNWDNTSNIWLNSYGYLYTYNQQNKVLTQLYRIWDPDSSTWSNESVTKYIYNNNGQLQDELDYTRRYGVDTLVNEVLISYNYDANGNKVGQLQTEWDYTNNVWYNYDSLFFAYDSNQNDTLLELFTYIRSSHSWTNSKRQIFQFDGNNQILNAVIQFWNTDFYRNSYQQLYTYNVNNNLTCLEEKTWSGQAWEGGQIMYRTYDGDNNVANELFQIFRSDGVYHNQDFFTYHYRQFTASLKTEPSQLKATVYPNPTTDDVFLSINLEQPTHLSINIYEVNGRIVSTENRNATAGENKIQLNYPGMSSGNYIVRVTDAGGNSSTLKFIKQ